MYYGNKNAAAGGQSANPVSRNIQAMDTGGAGQDYSNS